MVEKISMSQEVYYALQEYAGFLTFYSASPEYLVPLSAGLRGASLVLKIITVGRAQSLVQPWSNDMGVLK